MERPGHGYLGTLVHVDPFGQPVETDKAGFGDELRAIFHAIWRRKPLIVLVMLVSIFLAVAYTRSATPLYTSTTELLIDPREKELTGGEVVPTGLGSSALGADTALVESQVSIITSESVIGRLIEQLNLESDPEFAGSPGSTGTLIAIFRALLYGDAEAYERSPYDQAKRTLAKRVEVKRVGNTYVVRIQSRSPDPEKAALISNTLAEIYVAQSRLHARTSTMAAAMEIDSRLDDLRTAATYAAQAAEDYREEQGLIGAQNLLVVEQQLRDINAQLSAAQSEAERARAELEQARLALSDPLNAGLGAPQSSLADNLRARLAEISAQETAASRLFLPNHPTLVTLTEERRSIEGELRNELTRVLGRFERAYNVAVQNAAALEQQLAELSTDAARSNSDGVRLRELEREAELSREIYETFLARSMQVNEQIGMQAENTRIISEAYPSSRPSHPKGKEVLAVALVGGLMIGLALAWLLHLIHGTPPPSRTVHAHPDPEDHLTGARYE